MHGHDELEVRVTTAYQRWVEPGAYVFRAAPGANGHHNAVRFHWELVTLATAEVASVGFDFVLLDDGGRITSDHQFVDR